MNMIRTTISLPEEVHEELVLLGIKEKKSLGQLVVEKIAQNREAVGTEGDVMLKNMARKLGKKRVDWGSEIKRQRQDRTKHLGKFLDNI